MFYLIRQRGLYWRPHSGGYTSHLGLAGVYKEEETMRIVKSQRDPPDIAIPIDSDLKEDLEEELAESQNIIHGCQAKLELIEKEIEDANK